MKTALLVISLMLIAPLNAQSVYTWEDENGVLHFSDNPASNSAEKLDLPDLGASAPAPKFESSTPVDNPENTTTTANNNASSDKASKASADKPQPEKPAKLQLTMLTPTHDQTIRSNRGLIAIQIDSNRKLGIGEQLQLMLDGRRYGAPQTTKTWELKNIDRGTHTIAIQAHRSGKLIASTTPVTVFLHRATVK